VRWFVGDVHGCARELDDLLVALKPDPSRDELWSVGDLVNRGPDSAAALRLFRDAGGRGVLGNHDLYALRAAAFEIPREGDDTLAGLLAAPDGPELLAWLAAWPAIVLLPGGPRRGICLVHAGLHPAWTDPGLVAERLLDAPAAARRADPDLAFATLVRCCTAEGRPADSPDARSGCSPPSSPWDTFYRGERFVVHGHWAQRGLHRTERVLGLDTGCAWGGRLSAWCPEEDRLVQVPARR
jgi:bis(5'-nucleosyl)-tetraphosphatase (symmetrical)